jgi:hypothetical protein
VFVTQCLDGGTAIDADAPSLIALAKQMELGFDALLRAPDAQRITGAVRGSWPAVDEISQ